MKLIFCLECHDVRKLHMTTTTCNCTKAWGWYRNDGLNAVIGGKAIPLGFDNKSLVKALRKRPKEGEGERFTAFVISTSCPTIEEIK